MNDVIRKAAAGDLSRIAEILVFTKRLKYRPYFQNDVFSFGELQVLRVAEEYAGKDYLKNIWVYDDGIVKGMIRIEGNEIVELYVDSFFQGQGIGSALIEFAVREYAAAFLWVIEKNTEAIHFYEAHGFHLTDKRKPEEGTPVYIVMMERQALSGEGQDREDREI